MAQKTNFFKFVENELKIRNLTDQTVVKNKQNINELKKFKDVVYVENIDFQFIENYKKYLIETLGYSDYLVKISLLILRTQLNWAVKKGIINRNPFRK